MKLTLKEKGEQIFHSYRDTHHDSQGRLEFRKKQTEIFTDPPTPDL